jgi:lysozyme family protein
MSLKRLLNWIKHLVTKEAPVVVNVGPIVITPDTSKIINTIYFDKYFDRLMESEVRNYKQPNEVSYSNDPDDAGGPTRYGVTEKEARANGYQGDMKNFPLEMSKAIAYKKYWEVNSLDWICRRSEEIAYQVFEGGFNCGVRSAGMWLQLSMNAFNLSQKLYPNVEADGEVGQGTVKAWNAIPDKKLVSIFLAVEAYQFTYYMNIVERKESQEKFIDGWIARAAITPNPRFKIVNGGVI